MIRRAAFTERRHDDPAVARRVDESLDVCWKEGISAQLMIGIFDYYLVPFALFLGASTQEIGFLVSLPFLLGAVSQFFAMKAVQSAGSRHRLIVRGAAVQAALLLPVCLLVLVAFPGRVLALVALVSAYQVLGTLIGPAWGSLVSDYLPENRRGEYFGWRSQIVGVTGVVGVSLWGLILNALNRVSAAAGFLALFLCAAVFRFVSLYYLSRMVDLPMHFPKESEFTFWMFVRRFRESNFVRFVFYVASITFATQLAAAYFSVYMLRDLKFDYLTYMVVHSASVLASLVAFPLWGRNADMAGNAKVLKVTSFIIPVLPFLWALTKNPFHLILIEMASGFVWCGFNLCATNFIYDAVSPQKRVRCLGYFNLLNGTAIFLGASLGGFLAGRLPAVNGSPLVTLFLISGACRFLADFFLSRHFREVRATARKVRSAELFMSVLGVRPLAGENVEIEPLPLLRRFVRRRVSR